MGGRGSGSWYRWKTKGTVGQCRSLDVGRWVREGIIEVGYRKRGGWGWWDPLTKKEQSSISYESAAAADGTGWVELSYALAASGRSFRTRVPLETTRPHFGGVRWWFVCPLTVNGRYCGRRVTRLYFSRSHFGCRLCHGLTYRSCQEAHQKERIGRMMLAMRDSPRGIPSVEDATGEELLLLLKASRAGKFDGF